MPSKEESHEMLKWLNRNRLDLLDFYRNQYVAYNAEFHRFNPNFIESR
ncbi:hypothetical protein [Microcoleus sp. N9_A1]